MVIQGRGVCLGMVAAAAVLAAAGGAWARATGPVAHHVVTPADWVHKPDAAAMTRNYPRRAQREGVAGHAVIECHIALDGRAEGCQVLSEDPPGYAFGAAALRISAEFRFRPATVDGVPVAGTPVKVPIRFTVPPPRPLFAWPKAGPAPVLQLLAAVVAAALVTLGLGAALRGQAQDATLDEAGAVQDAPGAPVWSWICLALGVCGLAAVAPSLLRRSAGSWTHLSAAYADSLDLILVLAVLSGAGALAAGLLLRGWLAVQSARGRPWPRSRWPWGYGWGMAVLQSGDAVGGGLALITRLLTVSAFYGLGVSWLLFSGLPRS